MAVIQLIGPGAAGKTTVGRALASRLGLAFIDLDQEFTRGVGDISDHIDRLGYESYARANVTLYQSVVATASASVIALPSGFMTYPANIHPSYVEIRSDVAHRATTFVLIPAMDFETCVWETVRRQVARSFGRSADKEEAIIRERYGIYVGIPAMKIETTGPVQAVVDQIAGALPPHTGMQRIAPSEKPRGCAA